MGNSVTLATKLKQEDLKAVVKKLSAPLLLFLIVATFIISCTEKPETIGLDLVDDDAPITGLDTTIEVVAYSRIEEPIYTDETSINMVGSMTTSTFGQTNASFYSHIRTSLLNPEFGPNPVFDSAILTMVYNGAYGNISSEQTFTVHRVTQEFYFDSSYYSNSNFDFESGYNYADYTFFPDTTRETLVDTSNSDTTYQAARLKISLNEQFGQDIFNLQNEYDSVWSSNDKFTEYFNGLFIKPESISNTGEGGIIYFDMLTDYSNLTLYWKNDDEDSLSLRFLINSNCARVAQFEHDYSLSSDPNFVLNADSTILGNDRIFLQCMAGVNTEISFPGIKSWADSGVVTINEAKLILTVDDYEPEYKPATSLVMFKNVDSDDADTLADTYDFLRDQMQGDAYFGGSYQESSKTYTYRLSLHMQDLIDGEVDLGVALFPTAKAVKANEIKLFGTDQSLPGRLKMNIIYTKIQ